MPEKKYSWYKIADYITDLEFGSNDIAVAAVKGKPICVAKWKGQIFAFAHKCPHASGLMAAGFIDSLGNVVCPLHRYKFNMATGRNSSGEGYFLKHWPVEIRNEAIYVGMEESTGFLGMFK